MDKKISSGMALPCLVMLIGVAAGCVRFAAPPPWMTLDGPATVAPHEHQVGFGAGTGWALFPGAHSGGQGWFGRWRMGWTEHWDFGVDAMGIQHGDKGTFSLKMSLRRQVLPWLRIEGGLGAADDSFGKSLGADLAAVVGPKNSDSAWRPYGAVRLAGAWGFRGSLKSEPENDNDTPPPDALFVTLAGGLSARVSDSIRFLIEGGYGRIFVRGYKDAGASLYFGVGLLCDIKNRR